MSIYSIMLYELFILLIIIQCETSLTHVTQHALRAYISELFYQMFNGKMKKVIKVTH